MKPSLGISVTLLRPLAEVLGRIEVDPRAFLASLDIDDATSSDTNVSAELVDQRFDEIATAASPPTRVASRMASRPSSRTRPTSLLR